MRHNAAAGLVNTILKPQAYSLSKYHNKPQNPLGFFGLTSSATSPDNRLYYGSSNLFASSSAFILIGLGGSLKNVIPIIGVIIPRPPHIMYDILQPTAPIKGSD